jgi:flagellar motor switch protein FliN
MPERVRKNLAQVLRLAVPVIVRIGERPMSVAGVTALAPGTILELSKAAEEELLLAVNNQVIARGQAVKVGENFGIRLTSMDAGPPPGESLPKERQASPTAEAGGQAAPVAPSE